MKFRNILHSLLWMAVLFSFRVSAQESTPLALLIKDYPLLMEKFGNELKAQRANYLFAIDVSGTMNRYEEIVVPAMSQFVESLAEGDNVSVIRFGTEAKVSLGGFSDVNEETKSSLKQYIQTLYKRDPQLYSYTDLNSLLDMINRQLLIQKNNLTFIFVLTDFINDPAKGKPDLTRTSCQRHLAHLKARAVDHSIYMYALQLPTKGVNDLPLFKTAIPENFQFEEFSITSSTSLKNWFDRKKAEILLDKFRAIIRKENKGVVLDATPVVNIDGHLQLDVEWKPSSLLEKASIDGVLFHQTKGFSLETKRNDSKCITTARAKVDAGQLKYQTFGFHKFSDSLTLRVSLPCTYENELAKLEIAKPTVSVSFYLNDWIFTSWLPLWLVVCLIAIFLFYLFMVCKAFMRNHSFQWRMNGKLMVEYRGRLLTEYSLNGDCEIGIGCDGTPVTIQAYGCDWQLTLFQYTFSCLKPWKKPIYKVRMDKGNGFVTSNGNFISGDTTRISRGDFIEIDNFIVTWCE